MAHAISETRICRKDNPANAEPGEPLPMKNLHPSGHADAWGEAAVENHDRAPLQETVNPRLSGTPLHP